MKVTSVASVNLNLSSFSFTESQSQAGFLTLAEKEEKVYLPGENRGIKITGQMLLQV